MSGIAVAGTVLLDKIHKINSYPNEGELTQVLDMNFSVGGNIPNVGIDIKTLCPDVNVFAIGKLGKDADADYIKNKLESCGLDTASLTVSEKNTSFTDVMSIDGGQRTFFTYAGACADFGYDDIPFDRMEKEGISYLHLAYFLLLDKIDSGDGEKILAEAKRRGIETSIDLVSENSDRYKLVLPCLPYVDNLIINEVEAGNLTGIKPTPDSLYDIALSLKKAGVRRRVIIHMPSVSVCLSENGFTAVPSHKLPSGYIKGTTGAGDAFCAGCILGIYKNKSDEDILKFGACAAVAALSTPDATSGMKSSEEVIALCRDFEKQNICVKNAE